MEHLLFTLIGMMVLAVILFMDKKHIKEYLWLMIIGLIFAYIFETVMTYLGFWTYYSSPKIPIMSLYTWLGYMPYLSICYFLGKRFGEDDGY